MQSSNIPNRDTVPAAVDPTQTDSVGRSVGPGELQPSSSDDNNGRLFETQRSRDDSVLAADLPVTAPESVNSTTHLPTLSLNWTERQLPERIRTKHVHRLHPYLGKYIPQLVEIFLRKYFVPGMTALDPFSGSGTTLVQSNELGVNSVGCDISAFNVLIGSVKTAKYDISTVQYEMTHIMQEMRHIIEPSTDLFSSHQSKELDSCNGNAKLSSPYLKAWFAPQALRELLTFRALISRYHYQDLLKVVLSRAARSSRLTTHFDLDFPKRPVTEPYECYKHGRVCRPTSSALKFLSRYSQDTVRRLTEFSRLRTSANVTLLNEDSRTAQFPLVDGVITSPPYVGLIDYHEQHKYAYELLGLPDNRTDEIGPAVGGQSKRAKEDYVSAMRQVFTNVANRVKSGGRLVVVAGDRYNLYPVILDIPSLSHEFTIQRHVNRRTGRRSGEFFESVFIYTKL